MLDINQVFSFCVFKTSDRGRISLSNNDLLQGLNNKLHFLARNSRQTFPDRKKQNCGVAGTCLDCKQSPFSTLSTKEYSTIRRLY